MYIYAVQFHCLCKFGGVRSVAGKMGDPSVMTTNMSPASPASKTYPINRRLTPRQLRKFIDRHLHEPSIGGTSSVYPYKDTTILSILDHVKDLLIKEETLLRVKAPVKVVGDIHGQFSDLRKIFEQNGPLPETKYLFLGDYVDRGRHSLETIMLLFACKTTYPECIKLLRGNHEAMNINRIYGFYAELEYRNLLHLYPEFNDVFNYLPLAAVISNKILCMHGGISKHITTGLDQIRQLRRPLSLLPATGNPEDAPPLAIDLLWADPNKTESGWLQSPRGVSSYFGMDVLEEFCRKFKLELIVRAHQVVAEGYERMGPTATKTRLVTVFSAPNYCNEFDNNAAVMLVGEKMSINFKVLESKDAEVESERATVRQNTPKYDTFPEMDATQRTNIKSMRSTKLSRRAPPKPKPKPKPPT